MKEKDGRIRRSQLQDQVSIITGANSGIGERVAAAFAAEGAATVLAARRRERLEAVAEEI